MIIIRMDGGICSQIYQYMIGLHYKDKGFEVKYDTWWYYLDGKDLLGNKNRKLHLKKLVPTLELPRSNYFTSVYYKKNYSVTSQRHMDLPEVVKHAYLGGYYRLPLVCYKQMKEKMIFSPKLSENIIRIRNSIIDDPNAVAVHVRRGDMAHQVFGGYWKEIPYEFYLDSMDQFINGSFYFFSDDPQWVTDYIVNSYRNKNRKCRVVDLNDSSNGYMDLYLLSFFSNYICGEGSLGKYGCLFSKEKNKTIVLPVGSGCDEIYEYIGDTKVLTVGRCG